MKTDLCHSLGLEIPLFAFTRSREVVVEVSKAGGMGVLGAVASTPESLEEDLRWIDNHVQGRPYGVDVVMPAKHVGGASQAGMGSIKDLQDMIPPNHLSFLEDLLSNHQVASLPEDIQRNDVMGGWTDALSRRQVEVALGHPISLIANALGPPPPDIIQESHERGVKVAALCGSVRHAKKQAEAGIDIIIAQGTEAGGHTGDISTFVLVPDIVDAVGSIPVLAAGGVGSGQQMVAALALGAQGVWTGSIWLTTQEALTSDPLRQKLVKASAHDTVRSKAISGKPARQLVSGWTKAWDDPTNPDPLPMPLQFMLTSDAISRIHYHAETTGETELLSFPVGQIVGRMNEVQPVRNVINKLLSEAKRTQERLDSLADPPE